MCSHSIPFSARSLPLFHNSRRLTFWRYFRGCCEPHTKAPQPKQQAFHPASIVLKSKCTFCLTASRAILQVSQVSYKSLNIGSFGKANQWLEKRQNHLKRWNVACPSTSKGSLEFQPFFFFAARSLAAKPLVAAPTGVATHPTAPGSTANHRKWQTDMFAICINLYQFVPIGFLALM